MGRPVKTFRKIIIFSFLTILSAQEDSIAIDLSIDSPIIKSKESETVIIHAPVKPIGVTPTAYRLTIYPRNHPAEPFMQKLFFPGEPIQVILPSNILNTDTLGNVAKLEPLGDAYDHQYRMFNAASGEITLPSINILAPADIIKLTVVEKGTDLPIPLSEIRVTQNGEILSDSNTDTAGYGRVRIPVKRNKEEPVLFSIDTDGRFPIWKGSVEVPDGVSEKTVKISSLNLEPGETIYDVANAMAPFREGPENGAALLFFLNEGDQVVISKVAGDRLYGRVRIYLDNQNKYSNISGWIIAKHVKLQD